MAERQYVVGWKRVEYGETVIMAASAAEAERIAFEVIDGPVWTFEAGGYIGKPKARLVRDPAQKRWLTGEGYREAAEPDVSEEAVCASCDVDPMAPHTNGCRLDTSPR